MSVKFTKAALRLSGVVAAYGAFHTEAWATLQGRFTPSGGTASTVGSVLGNLHTEYMVPVEYLITAAALVGGIATLGMGIRSGNGRMMVAGGGLVTVPIAIFSILSQKLTVLF